MVSYVKQFGHFHRELSSLAIWPDLSNVCGGKASLKRAATTIHIGQPLATPGHVGKVFHATRLSAAVVQSKILMEGWKTCARQKPVERDCASDVFIRIQVLPKNANFRQRADS